MESVRSSGFLFLVMAVCPAAAADAYFSGRILKICAILDAGSCKACVCCGDPVI